MTDYNKEPFKLRGTTKIFEFFKGTWISIRDWKRNVVRWKACEFNKLDGEEVDKEVSN